jgi:hypothetical protein
VYNIGQNKFLHIDSQSDGPRFDYDARDYIDDIAHNNSILNLFRDLFDKFGVKVIIGSHKGGIAYKILKKHEEIEDTDYVYLSKYGNYAYFT